MLDNTITLRDFTFSCNPNTKTISYLMGATKVHSHNSNHIEFDSVPYGSISLQNFCLF